MQQRVLHNKATSTHTMANIARAIVLRPIDREYMR